MVRVTDSRIGALIVVLVLRATHEHSIRNMYLMYKYIVVVVFDWTEPTWISCIPFPHPQSQVSRRLLPLPPTPKRTVRFIPTSRRRAIDLQANVRGSDLTRRVSRSQLRKRHRLRMGCDGGYLNRCGGSSKAGSRRWRSSWRRRS